MRKNTSFIYPLLLLFSTLYFIFYLSKRRSTKPTSGMKQMKPAEIEFRIALNDFSLSEAQKRFVYAVAYHETGGFASSLCVNAKNYFGMRPAKKRQKHYVAVTSGNYAIYETASASIACFIGWWQFHKTAVPTDVEKGVRFMAEKKYYQDSIHNYKRGVENGAKRF